MSVVNKPNTRIYAKFSDKKRGNLSLNKIIWYLTKIFGIYFALKFNIVKIFINASYHLNN
jgi:hypothetical protein